MIKSDINSRQQAPAAIETDQQKQYNCPEAIIWHHSMWGPYTYRGMKKGKNRGGRGWEEHVARKPIDGLKGKSKGKALILYTVH